MKVFLFLMLSVLIFSCKKENDFELTITDSSKMMTFPYVVNLQDSNLIVLGKNYKIKAQKIYFEVNQTPVYVQWISNCTINCSTVVMSNPYLGFTWSDDLGDRPWLNLLNAISGIFTNDTEGPYVGIDKTIGRIFFKSQNAEQIASMGANFLDNGLSVLIINGRFYRGRNLKDYVDDFSKAVSLFVSNGFINSQKMAFYGASLGGFIAAHSSVQVASPPKSLVLVTPLLDIQNQYDYVLNVSKNITDNNVTQLYLQFFTPYIRRILDIGPGGPVENPQVFERYSVKYLINNLKSNFAIIHDTWDTAVPYSRSEKLYRDFHSLKYSKSLLLYQHDKPIDWNNFKIAHGQNEYGEGFNEENFQLFYMPKLYNELLSKDQKTNIYYNYKQTEKLFLEIKAAQNRGQDISWLRDHLLQLCSDQLNLIDYSYSVPDWKGDFLVLQFLKSIWGINLGINGTCSSAVSNL